jgi:hypothetical protein
MYNHPCNHAFSPLRGMWPARMPGLFTLRRYSVLCALVAQWPAVSGNTLANMLARSMGIPQHKALRIVARAHAKGLLTH